MSDRRLEEVRSELRSRGYLDHSVERLLLQDALRPEQPWGMLLRLASKVALLAGVPLALFLTLGLAARNGHLASSAFDLLPLFLHLLPPAVAIPGLAFLLLAGILALVLRFSHARRIGAVSLTLALLTAAAAVALVLFQGRALWASLPAVALVALGLLLPVLALAFFKLIHGGLLGLSVRLAERAPEGRLSQRTWWALGTLVLVLLGMLPVVLELRGGQEGPPASLPSDPRARVLVVGVDGVLPEELGYLMDNGELPAIAARLQGGGTLATYRRIAQAPASFWITVATGLPSGDHGMESVDAYRPLGVRRPLGWSGWLRHYWSGIAQPLGLVEYQAVLAHQRKAHTFWELAARGGAPVLVVNWWGTFPVEELPGAVVAHGAHQLLRGSAGEGSGAVFPSELQGELAASARDREALERQVELPAALSLGRDDLLWKALLPDAFYLQAFRQGLAAMPRAAALYLPALDIADDQGGAAGQGGLGAVAFGDLVRSQLRSLDRLLGEVEGFDTVLLVFDPGRRDKRPEVEGRVLLWRQERCGGDAAVLAPRDLASALLRGLGLPQSRELPAPPTHCTWPAPSLEIATFGERKGADPAAQGEEYLENLRSLGYL